MTEQDRSIPSIELYTDPESLVSRRLIRETAEHLDRFEAPNLYDLRYARDFLREETIPFIGDVAQGFHLVWERLREASAAEYTNVLRNFDKLPIQPIGTTGESFREAYIVFGAMPAYVDNEEVKGHLLPPASPSEFMQRVIELREQIARISEGFLSPTTADINNAPLLRTTIFFKTGRRMPLKLPENPRERQQKKDFDFGNFLNSIY